MGFESLVRWAERSISFPFFIWFFHDSFFFCFFTVAGISGTKDKGCNSLVLAGGYSDDKDLGYEFTYSGKVS